MQWNRQQVADPVALATARRAVQIFPAIVQGWRTLAAKLEQSGDIFAAVETLSTALTQHPDSVPLRYDLYRIASTNSMPDQALATAREIAAMEPSPGAQNILLRAFTASGRYDEARALFCTMEPSPANAEQRLKLLFSDNPRDWTAILAVTDEILAARPGSTDARYRRALALAHTGSPQQAASLIAAEPFLSMHSIEANGPVDDLCAALRDEILANPTMVNDPVTYSTRNGRRALNVLQAGLTAIPQLLEAIERNVDRYVEDLDRSGSSDPFVTARPAQVRLNPWAVVNPAEGYHVSHIHPSAWLSGVFYVAAPPGGEIVVGDPNPNFMDAAPWKIHKIQPIAGQILLFPSYVPHSTLPTNAQDLRITIPFDVLPA